MWWRGGLVLGALAAAFAPLSPSWVERVYSTSAYRAIQQGLTPLSNRVPVALFDLLILLALAGWLIALILDLTGRRHPMIRVLGRLVLRTIVVFAAFYLAFLGLWGLNYRRARLTDKLQFDAAAITPASARAAALTTVDQLNALHDAAHAMGWRPAGEIDRELAAAFARADRALGATTTAVAARPKATLLDWYFRRAGVDGMTDPYFLETLVQRDLLPFERPFVVAHEWSHLAGFADESEANFVGWLTCLRGSVADQYSGWLFLYGELARATRGADRAAIASQVGPGPRADLQAMADRIRLHLNPQMAEIGWRAYDQYLKANRIEAGTASYAEVVRLVLGVRFGPDWAPLLRASVDGRMERPR